MATTELTHSMPASAYSRLRILAAAGFGRLAAAWRAMRNRRSVARLLEWDDHMLRDIGITPGDVRSALASPLSDDPSYRLGAMSVERRAAFRATALEGLGRRVAASAKHAPQATSRVRSKSETLAAVHRPARRVPPHHVLEI